MRSAVYGGCIRSLGALGCRGFDRVFALGSVRLAVVYFGGAGLRFRYNFGELIKETLLIFHLLLKYHVTRFVQ